MLGVAMVAGALFATCSGIWLYNFAIGATTFVPGSAGDPWLVAAVVLCILGAAMVVIPAMFLTRTKRPDGTFLNKELSTFRLLNPVLIRGRTESQIFIPMKFDVTHTLEYIRGLEQRLSEKNGRPFKVTIFSLYLTAIIRTIAMRPQLNRFIAGHDDTWFYQRNNISFSFVAKKQLTDHAKETNVKMFFSPYETIFTVIDKLNNSVQEAKSEAGNASEKEMKTFSKFPFGLIKLATSLFRWLDRHNVCDLGMIARDVLYASAFVTNMGSMAGIGAQFCSPFHHLFTWGNASMFFGIGTHEPVWTKNESTGNFEEHAFQQFVLTYDDRISEGLYGARGINMLKDFIEHPEQLESPADIPKEVIDELKLLPKYLERPTTKILH
jgi:hypothetical protein